MDRPTLTALLGPVVAPQGLEIDRVDVVRAGRRQLVRVSLDGDGPTGSGPDLDQIAAATKAISAALDEADTGSQPYTLEVSSRGVGTPLTKPSHYRRNRGRLVSLHLRDGGEAVARIVSASDSGVEVAEDGKPARSVAYADIAKAVVRVEFRSTDEEE